MRIASAFLLLSLALAGCAEGDSRSGGGARPAPLVKAEAVRTQRFVDRIDAVGTALANEQVTLAAPVTERIVRLNFQDGAYVGRGQVIAVLAQGQEAAGLRQAQARQQEAGQQLQRLEALRARGFATRSSVESQAALSSMARAQADEARAMMSDRVIRAPFGGYVSLRTVSPGAVVQAGTEIATISDISRIKLDFTVPETLLSAIAEGQTIEARAAAWPDQPFRGTIATIDPVIDPATRSVKVRALLPNPDKKLRPGMLLTVAIEAKPRIAPAVPELALVGDQERRYVFRVGPDAKASRADVVVGVREGGLVEIVQGLKPGERVITEGVVKVSDGMTVRLAGAENAAGKAAAPKASR